MSMVADVRNYLAAQTEITAQLAEYDFGSGLEPALFTVEPAPEDSPSPLVVIQQPTGNEGTARDRSHKGGEIFIDVKLWGNRRDSEKALRNLADDLWLTMDRADITVSISGGEFVNCIATPPQRLSDPDGFPGFIIPCRITVRVTE